MPSTDAIKKELQTNTELDGFLEALKMIAATEYRVLEKQKQRFARFLEMFSAFLELIDFSSVAHPFRKRKGNLGIIMITSDEGFMGGLNTQVLQTGLSYRERDEDELIVIGDKGASYLRGMGLKITAFPGIKSEGRYEAALKLKDYIIAGGLADHFGRSVLVYPKSISFTVQRTDVLTLLPCADLFEKRRHVVDQEDVIAESELPDMIGHLIGTWITQTLLEVFEDSKLSEFSARTIRLEESHQILLEEKKKLKNQYFRSRREGINKGMQDMFSGQIVRRKKRELAQALEDRNAACPSGTEDKVNLTG